MESTENTSKQITTILLSSAKQNAILGAWIPGDTVLTQHMLGNKSRDSLNEADTDRINYVVAFIGSNELFLVQFLKIENKIKIQMGTENSGRFNICIYIYYISFVN